MAAGASLLSQGRVLAVAAPAAADLQWVIQAGWADPASHAVGTGYTAAVRRALGPLTSELESYVNMLDFAAG